VTTKKKNVEMWGWIFLIMASMAPTFIDDQVAEWRKLCWTLTKEIIIRLEYYKIAYANMT